MFNPFENLLAARNGPKEGLVELLVITAIIGFSVIKTFIRARAEMKQRESDKDSPQRSKPAHRKYAVDKNYEHKTLEQIREEKKAQIRAAFGIPTPPEEKKLVTPHPPATRPRPVVQRYTEPKPEKRVVRPIQQHPKAARLPAKQISKKVSHTTDAAPGQAQAENAYNMLFSSPRDLRTAILYSEILGKPVALRDAV
ncbi:MAG: hypothetical protein JW806_04840 [Sedimentisphaerales bacterium]|nr:hypothetical protein [Sedimentisphaerales bacterium]